ncbi:hypothetical protein FRX31_003504 [Thalictrum thalictroides]|uniref:Uncharacterized protein n=1 Tax=Thalictrum thalictroides TaxID=46969 RepID=A0A7J6XBP3_THATH|nr:hypothetical protein FRX31_003504 [Thalictrum thalictroides]
MNSVNESDYFEGLNYLDDEDVKYMGPSCMKNTVFVLSKGCTSKSIRGKKMRRESLVLKLGGMINPKSDLGFVTSVRTRKQNPNAFGFNRVSYLQVLRNQTRKH